VEARKWHWRNWLVRVLRSRNDVLRGDGGGGIPDVSITPSYVCRVLPAACGASSSCACLQTVSCICESGSGGILIVDCPIA
jgi:hypothetical protein